MREPLFGSIEGALKLAVPLRRGKAQPSHEDRQARTWQRRVDTNSHIDQRVDPRPALGCIGRCESVLMGSIDANATVATRHTEHATVEHGVQQMGGGIRRAAPVVRHRAVREMVVDLAWVYRAAFAYELQQEIRLL